jgi:hypothetical protein
MVVEGAREGAEVQMSASEANDEARMTLPARRGLQAGGE